MNCLYCLSHWFRCFIFFVFSLWSVHTRYCSIHVCVCWTAGADLSVKRNSRRASRYAKFCFVSASAVQIFFVLTRLDKTTDHDMTQPYTQRRIFSIVSFLTWLVSVNGNEISKIKSKYAKNEATIRATCQIIICRICTERNEVHRAFLYSVQAN